jgi:hypothetical protein
MRLASLLQAEVDALFAALPPPYLSPIPPRSARSIGKTAARTPFFHPSIPFELIVCRARLPGLLGRSDLTLAALFELVRLHR